MQDQPNQENIADFMYENQYICHLNLKFSSFSF